MKTWKTTNNQNDIVCRTGAGDVPYLSFPLLEQSRSGTSWILHRSGE